jgi:hypothetical protein
MKLRMPFVLQFAEAVTPVEIQPTAYDPVLQIMHYQKINKSGATGTATETETGGFHDTDSDTDFD